MSLETRWLIDRSVIWGSALCDDDGPGGCAVVWVSPRRWQVAQAEAEVVQPGTEIDSWRAGCNGDFLAAAPIEKSGGRWGKAPPKLSPVIPGPSARLGKDG